MSSFLVTIECRPIRSAPQLRQFHGRAVATHHFYQTDKSLHKRYFCLGATIARHRLTPMYEGVRTSPIAGTDPQGQNRDNKDKRGCGITTRSSERRSAELPEPAVKTEFSHTLVH